ncbi:MAG: STAS domain-containing protein [Candidatus Zhuqueibacterota bacterium]
MISVSELKPGIYRMSFDRKMKLSFQNSRQFRDSLNQVAAKNLTGLILNCGNLEFIDSSAISVLVSFIKQVSTRGIWLKICEANTDTKLIFDMIRLEKLAEILATEHDIMEQLQVAAISEAVPK